MSKSPRMEISSDWLDRVREALPITGRGDLTRYARRLRIPPAALRAILHRQVDTSKWVPVVSAKLRLPDPSHASRTYLYDGKPESADKLGAAAATSALRHKVADLLQHLEEYSRRLEAGETEAADSAFCDIEDIVRILPRAVTTLFTHHHGWVRQGDSRRQRAS